MLKATSIFTGGYIITNMFASDVTVSPVTKIVASLIVGTAVYVLWQATK